MFNKLRQKWKVNGWQLLAILTTFTLGGSLTGWLGRRVLGFLPDIHPIAWSILYIIVVTLIWPLMVILVSIPLGQFPFFRSYLARILKRIMQKPVNPSPSPVSIAIFASGTGSNAQQIIQHFAGNPQVRVALIVSNKPNAGVLDKARAASIPTLIIGIDFIVLAGVLWKVPADLIKAYPSRIVNIHPALLPKYGGKGMYGHFVHEAVIAAGEKESGITIHYVDEQYDHGGTIFQATCEVKPDDTPDSLAERIHQLEHQHFPTVIESVLQSQLVKNQ
jgi:folate-dependent phosphoribosylglycinamide formyltransferase PurN